MSARRRGIEHAPQHQRRGRPRYVAFAWKLLASVVSVAVVSALGIGGLLALDLEQSVKGTVDLHHIAGVTPNLASLDGGVNFLLVGDDSGGGDPKYGDRSGSRNDVTILVHLYGDHKNAVVVSFPRDMQVDIPACGADNASANKINVSYEYGGLNCTARTVEQLTGLSVDYAADLNFDGAASMSSAVGGVTVCLAKGIDDNYVDLHLKAGNVTLVGDQAIEFLRTRHGIGDGSDLGRVSNQQLFFAAMLRQTRSDLTNVPRLYTLAKAAAENMTLSSNLTNPVTLVQIALAFKSVDLDNIVFVQYPNHYVAGSPNVFPDTDSAALLNSALLEDKPITLTGQTSRGNSTTVAPTTPTTTTPATSQPHTSAPTTSLPSTATPTGPATTPPVTTVALPDDVTGQKASEKTCTSGNG